MKPSLFACSPAYYLKFGSDVLEILLVYTGSNPVHLQDWLLAGGLLNGRATLNECSPNYYYKKIINQKEERKFQ